MPNRFFEQNLQVKNGKGEQQHWLLQFRISLGTTFDLKLTILIFWTKFAQKPHF